MTGQLKSQHWKPIEAERWALRAYGRKVVLESEGGTLTTRLPKARSTAQLYLSGKIEGRMLIEVYQNDHLAFDDLIANDELDCFVDLPPLPDDGARDIEIHFIPAVHGVVQVLRSVQLVTQDLSFRSRLEGMENQIEIRDDLTIS